MSKTVKAITRIFRSMNDQLKTASDYRHFAQRKINAHYRMCERAKGLNYKLGISVTVATAIVGTTIFSTLNSPSQNLPVQNASGGVSLCAAVLSALQTVFNYSQLAIQHKEAAADYESVRRELDIFILGSTKFTHEAQLQPDQCTGFPHGDQMPESDEPPFSSILGVGRVKDMVTKGPSKWFHRPDHCSINYGLMLANVKALHPTVRSKGALSL